MLRVRQATVEDRNGIFALLKELLGIDRSGKPDKSAWCTGNLQEII